MGVENFVNSLIHGRKERRAAVCELEAEFMLKFRDNPELVIYTEHGGGNLFLDAKGLDQVQLTKSPLVNMISLIIEEVEGEVVHKEYFLKENGRLSERCMFFVNGHLKSKTEGRASLKTIMELTAITNRGKPINLRAR